MMCVIQWSFFSSNEFYSLLELLLPYTYHISLPEITSTTAQAKKKKNRRFECTLKEAEKNKGSEKSVSHSSLSLSIKQMMKNPLFII